MERKPGIHFTVKSIMLYLLNDVLICYECLYTESELKEIDSGNSSQVLDGPIGNE